MAVLVEILSVVIRRDAIDRAFRGGWAAFCKAPAPNRTLCSDGELIRIGFMARDDAHAYISTLEAGGLTFERDGQAADLALVHQQSGLVLPAPWLEIGPLPINGCKVVACWLTGRQTGRLAFPPGWKYEGSASQRPCFEGEADGDRVKFLRSENGVDVYLDLLSGKEVFVGRTVIEGETEAALYTQFQSLFREALNIETQLQHLAALKNKARSASFWRRLQDKLLPKAEPSIPFWRRLQYELLPKAEQMARGPGAEMAFAHFGHGLILRLLGRQEEAELAFRRANELKPGQINTLMELVLCLGARNKPQEALPFARQAVEVAPVDAGAWGNLASCLLKCGQRDEARKAITFAIDLDSQDPINCNIRDNFETILKKS